MHLEQSTDTVQNQYRYSKVFIMIVTRKSVTVLYRDRHIVLYIIAIKVKNEETKFYLVDLGCC